MDARDIDDESDDEGDYSDIKQELSKKIGTRLDEIYGLLDRLGDRPDGARQDRNRQCGAPSPDGDALSLHPRCGTRNPVAASGCMAWEQPAHAPRRASVHGGAAGEGATDSER